MTAHISDSYPCTLTYPISKLLFLCLLLVTAACPIASLTLDPFYPKLKDRVQISSNKLLIKTLLSGKAGKSLSFSMTGKYAFICEWLPQSDSFKPLAGLFFSLCLFFIVESESNCQKQFIWLWVVWTSSEDIISKIKLTNTLKKKIIILFSRIGINLCWVCTSCRHVQHISENSWFLKCAVFLLDSR